MPAAREVGVVLGERRQDHLVDFRETDVAIGFQHLRDRTVVGLRRKLHDVDVDPRDAADAPPAMLLKPLVELLELQAYSGLH